MKALGCFRPFGTKNTNTTKSSLSKPQRRNSRQSTATYTGIDFEYSGNTNNVHHLIKCTPTNPSRHPTNLNFELNLRTYRNNTKFMSQEPWEFPQAKKHYDPLQLDKPTFGHAHQLTKKGLVTESPAGKTAGAGEALETGHPNIKGNYLSSHPQNKKYSSKYRIKNVGELKMLLTRKGSSQPMN